MATLSTPSSEANDVYIKPKPPFILLPLYIYPSPGAWDPVFTAARDFPDLRFVVVVNPDNGPGRSRLNKPDRKYEAALGELAVHANVTILGYVHCLWGERDYDEVAADIACYYSWGLSQENGLYPSIRIDGIFFDEAPSLPTEETLKYMGRAAAHARSLASQSSCSVHYDEDFTTIIAPTNLVSTTSSRTNTSNDIHNSKDNENMQYGASCPSTIIYNPGVPLPHLSPFFCSNCPGQADYVVIFENSFAAWTGTYQDVMATSMASLSLEERAQSIVIVHGCPLACDQQRFLEYVMARETRIAGHFVIAGSDYSTWGGEVGNSGLRLEKGGDGDEDEGNLLCGITQWRRYVADANRQADMIRDNA